MSHAINHCELTSQVREAGHSVDDLKEMVMERAGQIVAEAFTGGKKSKRHDLPGVELMALSVAMHVINEGANEVAGDLELDLGELKEHATGEHISSC